MKQIRHGNILPALSSFVTNTDICIVTPLMLMGSARDLLDTYFPEGNIINLFNNKKLMLNYMIPVYVFIPIMLIFRLA